MAVTRRLFWEDPYQREFDSVVLESAEHAGRPAVLLEATCFYPTSGGQPHDLGTLNGIPVCEVLEEEKGQILHIVERPIAKGIPVHGVIDWSRRFDHMQQHSGQHLLSQAFERLLGAETVSFHLGEETCTIDVTLPDLDLERVQQIEALVNGVIFENRPVTAREYAEEEIGTLALRKAPVVHGRIRIVEVEGFDRCACGGTHVRATGEIGLVHIRGWERRRGQTRVEFLCGGRAQKDYLRLEALCREAANRLSVGVGELPEAVSRLQEALQQTGREVQALRKRLLESEAALLAAEAEPIPGGRLLCRLLEGYDAAAMRYIAQSLAARGGMVALLGVREPSPQVCFVRSQDYDADMVTLFRQVVGPYGGRGGGQPHAAQGGGMRPEDLPTVLERARALVISGAPAKEEGS